MLKNNTPYKGHLKFKFEKFPHYTDGTVLNKIHIDLGFTKLVSRINMDTLDPVKIRLINIYTGGRITDYKIKDLDDPNNNDGILPNSFVTLKGDYIGDIMTGWWYYLNHMTVCEDYPNGVAEIWNTDEIEAYYGYSHRGGATFKIGDKLFEADYEPVYEDYEPWQWAGWEQQYEQDLATAKNREDDWWAEDIEQDGISRYVPFNLRGSKTIESLTEAKQAAINLSGYLG